MPRGSATIGITTFNRPTYCTALLEQLASDEIDGYVDEVLVIDQGTSAVRDDAAYPAAAARLGSMLRLVEQPNLGGSGGFARDARDARRRPGSYVLLLDDDVVCEPEGIARAVAFADHARRPTIVGGHMFSMYQRSVLHAFAEVVIPWQFRWAAADPTRHDHDLATSNLRSTPWLHRRMDVDYNGWWMCLIPVDVLRDIGLSLPLFIKWDDAEYGLRAAAAGTRRCPCRAPRSGTSRGRTRTTAWTGRRTSMPATASSPRCCTRPSPSAAGWCARAWRSRSSTCWGCSTPRQPCGSRHCATCWRGRNGCTRSCRTSWRRSGCARGPPGRPAPDPEEFAAVRRGRPRKRDLLTARPVGSLATVTAAVGGLVRQALPVQGSSAEHPERHIPAADAGWWSLSRLDSALVSTTDGTGVRGTGATAGGRCGPCARAPRCTNGCSASGRRSPVATAPPWPTSRVRTPGARRSRRRPAGVPPGRSPAVEQRPDVPVTSAVEAAPLVVQGRGGGLREALHRRHLLSLLVRGASRALPGVRAGPGLVLCQAGGPVRGVLRGHGPAAGPAGDR